MKSLQQPVSTHFQSFSVLIRRRSNHNVYRCTYCYHFDQLVFSCLLQLPPCWHVRFCLTCSINQIRQCLHVCIEDSTKLGKEYVLIPQYGDRTSPVLIRIFRRSSGRLASSRRPSGGCNEISVTSKQVRRS